MAIEGTDNLTTHPHPPIPPRMPDGTNRHRLAVAERLVPLDTLGRPNYGRAGRPLDEIVAAQYLALLEDGSTQKDALRECNVTKEQIRSWCAKYPNFAGQVALARMEGAHSYADRAVEIAQKLEKGDIGPAEARVASDIYRWIASKHAPRAYGERLELFAEIKPAAPDLSAVPLETLREIERVLASANLGPDFKPKQDITDVEYTEG